MKEMGKVWFYLGYQQALRAWALSYGSLAIWAFEGDITTPPPAGSEPVERNVVVLWLVKGD